MNLLQPLKPFIRPSAPNWRLNFVSSGWAALFSSTGRHSLPASPSAIADPIELTKSPSKNTATLFVILFMRCPSRPSARAREKSVLALIPSAKDNAASWQQWVLDGRISVIGTMPDDPRSCGKAGVQYCPDALVINFRSGCIDLREARRAAWETSRSEGCPSITVFLICESRRGKFRLCLFDDTP